MGNRQMSKFSKQVKRILNRARPCCCTAPPGLVGFLRLLTLLGFAVARLQGGLKNFAPAALGRRVDSTLHHIDTNCHATARCVLWISVVPNGTLFISFPFSGTYPSSRLRRNLGNVPGYSRP